MIQLVGQETMAACVSRQKINLTPAQFSADERVGRRTKRRVDFLFGHILQAIHLVQTAAPDNADRWNLVLHLPGD